MSSSLPELTLDVAGRHVERHPGGQVDPFALVLFPATARTAHGFACATGTLRQALDALGLNLPTHALTCAMIAGFDALNATVSPPWLKQPELGWAGLTHSVLFNIEHHRSALALRANAVHLNITALAEALRSTHRLDNPANAARQLVRLLHWRNAIEGLSNDATVTFDLRPLLTTADDAAALDELCDELWSARPNPETLRQTCTSTLGALLELWLSHTPELPGDLANTHFPSAWRTALEGSGTTLTRVKKRGQTCVDTRVDALFQRHGLSSDAALKRALTAFERHFRASDLLDVLHQLNSQDKARAGLTLLQRFLTAQPTFGPADAHWRPMLDALLDVHAQGLPDVAHEALRSMVWRAPARAAIDLATTHDLSPLLDTLEAALLQPRQPPWLTGSAHASMNLARVTQQLMDQGHAAVGLRLLRPHADVDHPDPSLVSTLRALLAESYGRPFTHAALDRALLFPGLSTLRGVDSDQQHLARHLFNAIVGAVIEPSLTNDAEREAFFETHIARGLLFLEADPGTVRRRQSHAAPKPDRHDDSGPSLAVAILFLIGLIITIVLISLLLRRLA